MRRTDTSFKQDAWWRNFRRCGVEQIYRTCRDCSETHQMFYNCNLRWCPRCSYRITQERVRKIEAWSWTIRQPKHLVLTQANFGWMSRAKIAEHMRNLKAMRRTVVWQHVKGGCTTCEITNGGRGWHLHSHSLLDVRWLDVAEVARTWGRLVGQEYAIVKVMDARKKDYLHEVTKYVVKGQELAAWEAGDIYDFIMATRGNRFFFQFGSLLKQATQVREFLAAEKASREKFKCKCGCGNFKFRTPVS